MPSAPRVGEVVGRYRLIAEVAQGGMASVYAAVPVDIATSGFQKIFACKVMHPHLLAESRFVEMFIDEARISAKLGHPNIVQVIEVGEHDSLPFLVMEYLRGQSLSTVFKHKPMLSRQQLFYVLAETALGLHGAHEARDVDGQPLNVVHRDVSPQNIHVSYDGHVKVLDFGIAAASNKLSVTQTGEVKGKLSYLAPELLKGAKNASRGSDIWALGVMTWQAVARKRLFSGADDGETLWNVMNKEVPPLSSMVADLPPEVDQLVANCLDRDPDRRPATALAVSRVLRRAAGDVTIADVGEWMSREFAVQRGVEQERLAASLNSDRSPLSPVPLPGEVSHPGPATGGESSVPTGASGVGATPLGLSRSRALWAAGGVVVAALAALGIGVVAARSSTGESTPLREELRAGAEVPGTVGTASPAFDVIVAVPVDATRVTVDGIEHSERPVRAHVTAAASRALRVEWADGRSVERPLTIAEPAVAIAAPVPLAAANPPANLAAATGNGAPGSAGPGTTAAAGPAPAAAASTATPTASGTGASVVGTSVGSGTSVAAVPRGVSTPTQADPAAPHVAEIRRSASRPSGGGGAAEPARPRAEGARPTTRPRGSSELLDDPYQ